MADIIEILKKEDSVMDEILSCQGNIREAVKQRDWLELEKNITKMQSYTVDFICLDDQRDSLKKADFSNEEHELMKIIQSKLIKSKIENTSLSDYVNISHGFVQNVLENVVPQRRNVLYSKNGSIVKKQPQSVVLNRVF
ncbi:MAG: hypothetical protein J6X37_01685 [Treponema sp.]|uniref:hypothetical protein n=1 Tax=Treponema sp. TaxID=166 RepID=UPI001B423558|nr:hypothetical protein [Treponema sp.]MBP5587424.1 hypothetical protein [Treponema sp.]MCR5387244.1 hypothetical protein [Treponema sp.]